MLPESPLVAPRSRRTIAAIATAPGRGGVAVVRVSGPEAFGLCARLTGRPARPGRIAFAKVRDAEGRVLDECVVLAFAGPHSYTGEDVVEFQGHGGVVSPRRILEACFAAGACLAERGEFTERAFLNGRLDLSAAESVVDLVDARTDRAADDALARGGGALSKAYRALYDRALDMSVRLEYALDVDEGDFPDGYLEGLAQERRAIIAELDRAVESARRGRMLREGALVVLAGPPNAGKSSLLNALLDEARAIVSDVPGTTRDAIEAWLDLDGWPVRLVDTAGLRETFDAIEREGVRRAEDWVARADVVLLLGPEALPDEMPPQALPVQTKADLGLPTLPGALRVSVRTGEGLEDLRRALVRRLEELAGDASEAPATPSARERSLLAEARKVLSVDTMGDPAVEAESARLASQQLGRLVGAVYSEDLLDALFSRFCVGK